MQEAMWREQMKKDISNSRKNQSYKQNELENMAEESFSMNDMQNGSMSIANSD